MRIIFAIAILSFFFVSCGEDCKFNAITNESLQDGIVGQEYNEQLYYDISCSYASKSVELVKGELPPGIELQGDGKFSGIPTEAGEFAFTVKMRICFSSNGYQYTDCTDRTKEFTITIYEQ